MINTTNKKKRIIGRKQIRLSDLYRYMATGLISNIRGIEDYHCNKLVINIRFSNSPTVIVYRTDCEQDRLAVIREINKKLTEVI